MNEWVDAWMDEGLVVIWPSDNVFIIGNNGNGSLPLALLFLSLMRVSGGSGGGGVETSSPHVAD